MGEEVQNHNASQSSFQHPSPAAEVVAHPSPESEERKVLLQESIVAVANGVTWEVDVGLQQASLVTKFHQGQMLLTIVVVGNVMWW